MTVNEATWEAMRAHIDAIYETPADRIIAARDLVNWLESYISENEAIIRKSSVTIGVPPAAFEIKGGK